MWPIVIALTCAGLEEETVDRHEEFVRRIEAPIEDFEKAHPRDPALGHRLSNGIGSSGVSAGARCWAARSQA